MLLAYGVHANSEDALSLEADNLSRQASQTMTWPMLPGENLNALAAKFYPKNKGMRKQFVFKALRLNSETFPKLDANEDFVIPTAIVIPTLKSLSANAGKFARNASSEQPLHMSYNIKVVIERVPKSLLLDYEGLVTRNAYLKEELAKLNEKIVFLQNKLNDLKLILDRTLTLPKKRSLKNLDAEDIKNSRKNNMLNEKAETVSIFDPLGRTFWLWLLCAVSLLVIGSYVLKKYREIQYIKFINSVTKQEALTSFDKSWKKEEEIEASAPADVIIDTDTRVGEYNVDAILGEAKALMGKDQPEEAIEHLKWAIRAQPKKAINIWLHLLEVFRKQGMKTEFEMYAIELHQTFNVMTPLWEAREIEIVVAESLEKFPHIMERITAVWPQASLKAYLQTLINDNRDGERGGFGQAVIDEILTLIAVLEVREDLSEI